MAEGTNFLNWNWAAEHVQAELVNGEYISAESTLLLAGPSRLEYLVGANSTIESVKSNLYPIGLVQNFMMAQNRFLTRLFEIGSKRAYFVTGRLAANFQVNRVLFFGPSLMRLLYSLAPGRSQGRQGFGGNDFKFIRQGTTGSSLESANLVTPQLYKDLFPDRYLLTPGYGGNQNEDNRDFFINLASDLFQIPFGISVIFKDAKNRPYGACYLQDCYIEAHSMGIDANNVVIAEGVNGQFDQVAPVQLVSAGTTVQQVAA